MPEGSGAVDGRSRCGGHPGRWRPPHLRDRPRQPACARRSPRSPWCRRPPQRSGLPSIGRVGVRLSRALRSVGNPDYHWASRRRTVYLYIATFGPNARFCRDEGRRDHDRRSCVGHGGSRELRPDLWLRQLRSERTGSRPLSSRSARQCRRYGGNAPHPAGGCLSQPDQGVPDVVKPSAASRASDSDSCLAAHVARPPTGRACRQRRAVASAATGL